MAAEGSATGRFEPVREVFEDLLAAEPGLSAQLCVRWRGDVVVDLAGGDGLEADDLTAVFSVSKGMAALTVGLLVETGELDIDAPVARYWPEFAAKGKAGVTVAQLLSHQAGLVNATPPLAVADVLDSTVGAAKLAASRPLWRPGSAFGYHALTLGVFMEELVRRLRGTTLQHLYDEAIRRPHGIDAYLGLPEELDWRYRPVLPVASPPDAVPTDDLAALAMLSLLAPPGGGGVAETTNLTASRRIGPAAGGGVASARGLAALYAAAFGQAGPPLLSAMTIERMSQEQVWGVDRIHGVEAAFGVGFMRPIPRLPWGSYRAFGHDGMGGALGFADPLHDLSFGYVPRPWSDPSCDHERAVALSVAARRCASA
ncbi:MAG: beta-lactamase family protein [Bifidobacteriaceae bacterium]|jgi:CubicO group peptidase (beta-lactamase class C family)|nr:beta-lactamase family protein [Bifidobacteriaceae bacterium]